ncbi:WD40 repeat domain-containing protein [Streptomyces puniciscabiei]|uniref:WD40 repeat domain-containing protein n=1 Tax=Streptomyces puniciscabiei TaxID=164348 RepID=UPI00332BABB2
MGPLAERAALEDVLKDAASPQAILRELLGARQLWWRCCGEAARNDPSWLSGGRGTQLLAWLNSTIPNSVTDSVTAAEQAWLLASALAPTENEEGALERLAEVWERSGIVSADAAPGPAQLSGKGLAQLSPGLAGRLKAVVDQIQARPGIAGGHGRATGAAGVLVIGALLMAGVEPRRRGVVRVPVVFGRSASGAGGAVVAEGVTGVLELREFPPGPAGLYPDPRTMAGVRSPNGQFAASVGHAWQAAGDRREGRCVLWRLVLSDSPLPPVRLEGPSLGAAFALGLRELLRHPPSGRPGGAWLRDVFYGLRPRTAVTGALDGGERLLQVSDMDAKLLAARRMRLRLVAPEANRLDVVKAPEPGDVRFAATLRQADRYARRYRTGRLAVALALVVTAASTGAVVTQQDAAATQRLTTAHRLAEVSQGLLHSDVGLAELFAVQAYRYHPDTLTRTALFQAVTASPHLAGSVQANGQVSAVAGSGDGHVAFAGTQQGEVEQWTLTGSRPGGRTRLGRLPGSVTSVAADTAGHTVAAIDHDTVRIWSGSRPATAMRIPTGQRPTTVAVSPSGRFTAVTTTSGTFGDLPTLWVLDRTTGDTRHLALHLAADASALTFSADASLVAFESGYGSWERVLVPALTRAAGSTVGFGVHNQASALAPDGSHFTYTNGSAALPIWPSKGAPNIDKPSLSARTEIGHPATALALSSGASWAAEAVGSSIYVSRTAASGQQPSAPLALTGAGTVTQGALTFLGADGARLLSASGDILSLWDLTQYSRIAKASGTTIPPSCNGCGGPRLTLSPDGRSGAVIDGFGTTLTLLRLDPPGTEGTYPAQDGSFLNGQGYAATLWQRDNRGVIVMSAQDGSAKILSPARGPQTTGSWQPVPYPLQLSDPAALLQFLPDGRQVAEIDNSGTIRFRDASTGKVLRQLDGPRDMAPTGGGSSAQPSQGWAALDTQGTHAAVIDPGTWQGAGKRLIVTDTATGRRRQLPGAGAQGVAFAGDRLLVQRDNGDLEMWTASGDRRLDRAEGAPHTSVGPAVGGNLVAEKADDDSIQLIDLASGHTLGTLALPPGSKAPSTALAFSADGTELVTATESYGDVTGDTGTLIVWTLDANSWTRDVCSTVDLKLTPTLWKQYIGSDAPSNLRCPT